MRVLHESPNRQEKEESFFDSFRGLATDAPWSHAATLHVTTRVSNAKGLVLAPASQTPCGPVTPPGAGARPRGPVSPWESARASYGWSAGIAAASALRRRSRRLSRGAIRLSLYPTIARSWLA